MKTQNVDLAAHLLATVKTPDELHAWVNLFCGLDVPREKVCEHHNAPFDYLVRAYFEPAKDQLVWAPRGGGKTRLAAVATLLDLLHKPPCQVRILGGSFEQSMRMWEHLLPNVREVAPHLLANKTGIGRRVELTNGSKAAVLAQSEKAVRGLRVQKLRCDEVELFDPDVWEAAQLITKSSERAGGAIDALSTMHTPYGLMSRLVDRATHDGTAIVRWCLLEVLEPCEPTRDCGTCPLWDECRGMAKTKTGGFVKIDDAIRMKQRVSEDTWNAEMLCKRPSTRSSVFPMFDKAVHVIDTATDTRAAVQLAIDFGYVNPFVCLWVIDDGERVFVIDELIQTQAALAENLASIERRPWMRADVITCDPAGSGRNDQTATSNVAVLRSRGYTVRHRKSLILDGVEMIRAMLKPAAGEPKLFVHRRCATLIKSLVCYRHGEGTETPVKDGEHDHAVDALRYFFVNRNRGVSVSRAY